MSLKYIVYVLCIIGYIILSSSSTLTSSLGFADNFIVKLMNVIFVYVNIQPKIVFIPLTTIYSIENL